MLSINKAQINYTIISTVGTKPYRVVTYTG